MKIEDIVEVFDGSYSMTLIKGEMRYANGFTLRPRRFRVISLSGMYPTSGSSTYSGTNDILLVDISDPDFVLFTQKRFCRILPSLTPAPKDQLEITIPHGTKSVHLILRKGKEL